MQSPSRLFVKLIEFHSQTKRQATQDYSLMFVIYKNADSVGKEGRYLIDLINQGVTSKIC